MSDPVLDILRAIEERLELLTAARDALQRYVALGPLVELVRPAVPYPAANLATPTAEEVRRARPSDAGVAASLSPERARVLTAIRKTPGTTSRQIRKATGQTPATVTRHLAALVRAGLVSASGKTSGRRYAPA